MTATLELAPRLGGHGRAATAVPSEPMPCVHGGLHEHGSRACYVLDECRCLPCSDANSAYQDRRRRLIAAGQWAPLVDAGPVATHVSSLIEAGMQRAHIVARAGVAHSVVSKLLNGDVRRVRSQTAQALLAVSAVIDGTGTRRRLQALVAIGWPPPLLDEQLGEKAGSVERLLQADQVSDTTAGQVDRLFERLWDRPPPQRTTQEQQAADEARARAHANGWGPPMAWDDELNPIDNPEAEPDLGEKVRINKVPPADDLLFLTEAGETDESIAYRFGVKVATIRQALTKARAARNQAAETETPAAVDEAAA